MPGGKYIEHSSEWKEKTGLAIAVRQFIIFLLLQAEETASTARLDSMQLRTRNPRATRN
jgi:hypothetical protein